MEDGREKLRSLVGFQMLSAQQRDCPWTPADRLLGLAVKTFCQGLGGTVEHKMRAALSWAAFALQGGF